MNIAMNKEAKDMSSKFTKQEIISKQAYEKIFSLTRTQKMQIKTQ